MQSKNQNFLGKIVKLKKAELVKESTKSKKVYLRRARQSFLEIFKADMKKIVIIAEVKFASPTTAYLGKPEDLLSRAKEYETSGADAISLITEKNFFNGNVSFISQVKEQVSLPVLQKDFVIDEKQIYEAKEVGSDALLLIARLLKEETLQKFVTLCFSLDIEPVVEINNEKDLAKALATQTNIIAVNARDLETFAVDVQKACLLIKKIPTSIIKLGFSGIHSSKEVLAYKKAGVEGILIGTSLMRAKDINNFIEGLAL